MKSMAARFFVIVFLLVGGNAIAHDGSHFHKDVSEKTAKRIAVKTTRQFVNDDSGFEVGRLDKTWKKIGFKEVNIIDNSDGFYELEIYNGEDDKTLYTNYLGLKLEGIIREF